LPKAAKVKEAEVRKFRTLIKSHSSARLSEKELVDEYSDRVRKLAARKERKKEDVYELPEEVAEEAADTQVIDLVEVLKRSLGDGRSGRRKAGARKSGRKPSTRKSGTRKRARRAS